MFCIAEKLNIYKLFERVSMESVIKSEGFSLRMGPDLTAKIHTRADEWSKACNDKICFSQALRMLINVGLQCTDPCKSNSGKPAETKKVQSTSVSRRKTTLMESPSERMRRLGLQMMT